MAEAYKLLKPGDLETKLSRERFTELVRLVSEREAIEEFNGEEGITVREAMGVLSRDLGVSQTTAETVAYDYLRGNYPLVTGQSSLSHPIKTKAEALERRLIGLYNSVDINNFNAEEEIPIPTYPKNDIVKFRTHAQKGVMEIGASTRTKRLFQIYIQKGPQEPMKPKPMWGEWFSGMVFFSIFPPTHIIVHGLHCLTSLANRDLIDYKEWLHDVYVLPFKYAAYGAKKVINRFRNKDTEPKVTIHGDFGRETIEGFLSRMVGNSDRDYYGNERFALKNLVPAVERDIRQAQDYAANLEV